jgi:hypothetical protein
MHTTEQRRAKANCTAKEKRRLYRFPKKKHLHLYAAALRQALFAACRCLACLPLCAFGCLVCFILQSGLQRGMLVGMYLWQCLLLGLQDGCRFSARAFSEEPWFPEGVVFPHIHAYTF